MRPFADVPREPRPTESACFFLLLLSFFFYLPAFSVCDVIFPLGRQVYMRITNDKC